MFSTTLLKHTLYLSASFFLLFWAGTRVHAQQELSGRATRQLQEMVDLNEVFAQGHTGFVLYDLDYQTSLYGYNADRYFVPASNVKLLTFYLANQILGHRTPALFYQEYTDHLEIWGTGYPLLMHPSFTSYDEAGPWFANQKKPMVLHFPTGEGQDIPRYGAGWSWDDYNDGYVYERSVMPIYGNRLFLDLLPVDAEGRQILLGAPVSIAGAIRQKDSQHEKIRRSEFGNDFTVSPIFMETNNFPVERPLHLSDRLISNELAGAFSHQRISSGQRPYPAPGTFNSLEASLPDTVFRKLLLNSDNFLAEQLLVQVSARRYGRPAIASVIDYAKDTLLPAIGVENIRWVDGSGLSRYNLMTPRHLARVVMALDQEVGRDRFLSLLPQGGGAGTLQTRFKDKGKPYIWAKTGSLSGVVCLSGLLQTKQGKWLAFSFMHNNLIGQKSRYYEEMEKILGWCFEHL